MILQKHPGGSFLRGALFFNRISQSSTRLVFLLVKIAKTAKNTFKKLSQFRLAFYKLYGECSATSFLRNWDSILEKKRANLRSISEPARLRQPPPRSTGAAHARGRAQSIREERRIAAPPVLFALLWVRLLPALYGPFCGPLRPFGGCPWGVTPPARECLPPAPPDTRRRG